MLLDMPIFPDLEHSMHISVVHMHVQCFRQAGLATFAQTFCALAAVCRVMEAGCHTKTWGLRALNPCNVNSSECWHQAVRCFEGRADASCLWIPLEKALKEQKNRLVSLGCNTNKFHHFSTQIINRNNNEWDRLCTATLTTFLFSKLVWTMA